MIMAQPPPNNSEPDIPDGPIPDDGRIARSPAAQTIMAVALLIFVTIVAFFGVAFIGTLLNPSQTTYWLIELIFALLCAGAGALVGGSVEVRTTLNLPGSPVHARLGGAIAMVIVGFAVAYAGKPPDPGEQLYTLEIQDVQQTVDINHIIYSVGFRVDNGVTITKGATSVTIGIPSKIEKYTATLTVFTNDANNPKIFAKCMMTFANRERAGLSTMQLVPESDKQFRIYLSSKYVAKVVHASIAANQAVDNEPCVEGVVATEKAGPKLLSGYFTLAPSGTRSRLSNFVHLDMAPPYSVTASVIVDDLPPEPKVLPGGVTSQQPVAPAAPPSAPGSQTPASAQPSVPAVTPPTTAATPGGASQPSTNASSTSPAPVPSNAPPTAQTLNAQVDAYIRGENLDRTQLYQSWDQVAGYVVQGFRTAVSNGSPSAARYVNLIANALNVIDEGKYRAPTLRPNWNLSIESDRLAKSNMIPGFEPDDYKRVVGLLCGTDLDSKTASQRLLRSYPANNFYQPIQDLQKQTNCDLIFVSESAIYYFYNRLVEYDGTFALDSVSLNWLVGNYNDGSAWVKLVSAKDPNHSVFGALLNYGYGLVLWDRGPTNQSGAISQFKLMLQTIGSSNGIYPSNPGHIATALKELNNPGVASKIAASATPYNASGLHPVSGNYIPGATSVALFALPDVSSKTVGDLGLNGNVRIYMRADNWDLVQAGAQIGWAQRKVTSAGN
jgi:hypothetical protein